MNKSILKGLYMMNKHRRRRLKRRRNRMRLEQLQGRRLKRRRQLKQLLNKLPRNKPIKRSVREEMPSWRQRRDKKPNKLELT
jgi:hypothetical protein